jgi:electron transfer flavoprotein alpha subunit
LAAPQGICVLAEVTQDNNPTSLTLELLGLGSKLASATGDKTTAVLLGNGISAAAQELAKHGADEVLFFEDMGLAEYDPEIYTGALAKLWEPQPPAVVLAGHTALGQDLLPRLAFSLGAGLITDCVGVEADAGGIAFTKPIYGGNGLATQKTTTPTSMATVRARVGDAPPQSEPAGEVKAVEVEMPAQSRLQRTGKELLTDRECPLEEAPVVVSGGRGMGGDEGFEQLRELAMLLGGGVGASRPPVDSGWAPTTCQVGITGKVVAPDIYIAVAISGSTQHLSGMGESGKIIAINKDPEAYIFKVSDYGAVGDWKQVLPAFTAALREMVSE